jgi:F1F0 ATPase subunit 2
VASVEGSIMTDLLYLLGSFGAGMALGFLFFRALKTTVDLFPSVRRPELLALGSFVVRTGGLLVGFYLVMGGHWERLIACLFGFIVMRKLVVQWWKPRQPAIRTQ